MIDKGVVGPDDALIKHVLRRKDRAVASVERLYATRAAITDEATPGSPWAGITPRAPL